MNLSASLSLSDRLVMTLDGLFAAVAARFRSGVITVAMIHLVCRRIRRVEREIVRLLALFQAGTLPPEPEPAAVVRGRGTRVRLAAGERIPRGFGWLIRVVPYVAATYSGQLRAALAEPEMVALLAASARARRLLGPVCHMLMIERSVLAPRPVAGGGAESGLVVGSGQLDSEPLGLEPLGLDRLESERFGSTPAVDGLPRGSPST